VPEWSVRNEMEDEREKMPDNRKTVNENMNKPIGTDTKKPNVGRHEKQQNKISYWLNKCSQHRMLMVAVLFGLALSLTAFFVVNKWETQSRKQGFERSAVARCQLFENEVRHNVIRLKALKQFFDGSQFVDRNDFANFIGPLHMGTPYPVAFYWAPRVWDSDRHSFEKAVQAEGYAGFNIHCDSPIDSIAVITQHREYYPVLYRCDDAIWALAFDMLSTPDLKKAIEKAIDIDQPVITTSAILPKGQKDRPDVCIFYPVYHTNLPVTTVEDRRLAIEGVVTCVVQIGDIFDHVIHELSPVGMNLELADLSLTEGRQLLYQYKSRLRSGDTGNDLNEGNEASGLVYTTTFDIADRTWEMRATPSLVYLNTHSIWVCWVVFIGGLLLTALLVIQFYLIRNRTIAVEKLVTERTAQLRDSNERFQIAFETANIAICLVDIDGGFRSVNNQMCTMYGYSREELFSMTVKDITHPEDTDVTPEFIQQASSGEIDHKRFVKRYIHKEGHILWGEVSSSVVRDAKCNPLYFISYVLDITERKGAEEKLRESEEKFRALYDNAPLSYQSLDEDGCFNDVNPTWLRTLGYEKEEVIGKRFLEFLHPDWKPHFEKNFPEFKRRGYVHDVQFKIRHKDGHYLDISFEGCIGYWPDGRIRQTYCVFQDITERKQTEKKLQESERLQRTLIGNLPGMAYRCSNKPDWPMEFVSEGCLALTGYTQDELTDTTRLSYGDLIHPDDRQMVWDCIQKAVRRGEPFVIEYRLQDNEGGERWMWERGRAIYEESGGTAIIEGFITDITESKRAEEALRVSENQLQILIDAMPDFVCFMDGYGRWLKANDACIRIFQLKGKDYRGKKNFELAKLNSNLQDSFLTSQETDARAWNENGLFHGEEMIPSPDGQVRSYDVIKVPIFNSSGERKGLVVLGHDVTESKKAQDALKKSENNYKVATEAGRIAVWRVKLPEDTVDSSGTLERLLGYEPGEIDDWKKINHPEDKDRLKELWKNIHQKKADRYDVEQRLLCKDGNFKWFSSRGQVVWDDETKGFIVGTTQDINERKQMEIMLEESEEMFRAISSSAHDAIVMIDNDGNITYWNDAAEDMFEHSVDEVFGRNFHEIFVSEKFHEQHQKAFKKFQNTGEGVAMGTTIELEAHRKDGTIFPVDLSLSSVKLNEKWHAIGIVRDITERKLIEEQLHDSLEKFRTLYEASSDAVILLDEKKFFECNKAALNMFGFSTMEELCNKGPVELSPPIQTCGTNSEDLANEYIAKAHELGNYGFEWIHLRSNGTTFPCDIMLNSLQLSGKHILQVVIRDMTKRKREEEERQALEEEINQARKLEAVGSLASGIAHEINTPIQFVGDNTNFLSDSFKTLISLIKSCNSIWQEAKAGGDLASLDSKRVKAEESADLEYLKEEVPSAIEQTLDGVQRVTKIVRAMKDFAHSDQGTMSPSNINDMLESTLTVARNELKYVADVETNFDRELPDIECYRDDLNQVFLNLLVNAAHTIADVVGDSSAIRGTITVSTERDNDNVVIRIKDTGTGIPKEVRDCIFDPFFSTKDVGKGTGQGLAIVRKIIVEKHKGKLDFETEEGKGTTFIIRLPITIHEKIVEVT